MTRRRGGYLPGLFFLRKRLLLWLSRRALAPAAGGSMPSSAATSPRLFCKSPAPTRMAPAMPTMTMSPVCIARTAWSMAAGKYGGCRNGKGKESECDGGESKGESGLLSAGDGVRQPRQESRDLIWDLG